MVLTYVRSPLSLSSVDYWLLILRLVRKPGNPSSAIHDLPAVAPPADRIQKLPSGGWLNEVSLP